ncbi:MAG: 5-formyltetrahydrofolate cyclo-ligase [Nitriliruptoraceae bacterium]
MGSNDKQALRASALAARRQLSRDERAAASARAVERLLELPELAGVRTVLLFAATRDELDVTGAVGQLHQRGARTLLPRVRGDELELAAVGDLASLVLGYRGIREPAGPAIDPEVVEVAVVPGVAFDPNGGRLGHGGGHYDRLLERLPTDTVRVGAAFACQIVPAVPREEHDQPVDLVVTEHRVHRCRQRQR